MDKENWTLEGKWQKGQLKREKGKGGKRTRTVDEQVKGVKGEKRFKGN